MRATYILAMGYFIKIEILTEHVRSGPDHTCKHDHLGKCSRSYELSVNERRTEICGNIYLGR